MAIIGKTSVVVNAIPHMAGQCLRRYAANPVAATLPPMLAKLRKDMMSAMKAKDAARLDVIRGLMADATNASKTNNPITTDAHVLSLISKRIKSSKTAIQEFKTAGRVDLQEREAAQVAIMDEYVEGANVVGQEEISRIIEQVVMDMRSRRMTMDKGSIMKALVGPGGALDGRLVDRKAVATVVDGIL